MRKKERRDLAVALRSRVATTPRATPPLVTVPLASPLPQSLVPVVPWRHGGRADVASPTSTWPGRPYSGSLPSVCAFQATPCDVPAASSASTPTCRRAPSTLWTSDECDGEPEVVNDDDDEDDGDQEAVNVELVPWTSRRPFVRLRLLVILVIAFTVVGFIVFSPLFHSYM